MAEEGRRARAERQRRHPVWRSRRVAGFAVAEFSHWSDEEPAPDFLERKTREKEA